MKKIDWVIVIFLIAIFAWVFFFRLGWASLQSYDEAWYAVIARNIVQGHNPLVLWFNGKPFSDHPPLGFWLMALSYKLLGISEFATRVPSALMGIGSLVLTFLVGNTLINRRVGLMASVMLGSSLWFVLRARSGNLDVPLVFFYLLTIYFGLLYQHNRRLIIGLAIAFAGLLLVKTLVGASAGIILLSIIGMSKYTWKQKFYDFIILSCGTVVLLLPWYGYNTLISHRFLYHHFVEIALRGGSLDAGQSALLQQVLLYLHSGIGRWYSLALLSIPAILIFGLKKLKATILLLTWLLVVGVPFLLSGKTEIWHLLPLYPPLFLTIGTAIYLFSSWLRRQGAHFFPKLFSQKKYLRLIIEATPVGLVFFLAVFQLRQVFPLVFPVDRYLPPVDQIAKIAGDLPGTLYLKDAVGPEVMYYSGKDVNSFGINPESFRMMKDFLGDASASARLFIVPQNDLPTLTDEQVPFSIVSENTDYALISNQATPTGGSVYLPESQ